MHELQLLENWIPEQMEPGTLFVLQNAGEMGSPLNPYWAVMSCPICGALGLITRHQFTGMESIICGSDCCSTEFFLEGDDIRYRKPH
jgi:hypothetical protein